MFAKSSNLKKMFNGGGGGGVCGPLPVPEMIGSQRRRSVHFDPMASTVLTVPGPEDEGSVRNGGFKFAAHKKLPLPTEDENDSQTVLGSSGLPRKILHGEAGDDEDEETEKLRYRLAKADRRRLSAPTISSTGSSTSCPTGNHVPFFNIPETPSSESDTDLADCEAIKQQHRPPHRKLRSPPPPSTVCVAEEEEEDEFEEESSPGFAKDQNTKCPFTETTSSLSNKEKIESLRSQTTQL